MDEPIVPGLHAHLDNIAKTMGFNNWDRVCLTADPHIISDCVEMAVNNWSLKKAKDDYDKGYSVGYNKRDDDAKTEQSWIDHPDPGY